MIRCRQTWSALLLGLLLAVAGCYWLYHGDVFPAAGGDEQDLLSDNFHWRAFGDRKELVFLSENYNQRQWQKLPTPWTGWLRSAYDYAAGCSSQSSRAFSAVVLLACVAIAAVAAPLRSGLSGRAALLMAAVTAFSPPLFFAARTVRFEQEILLLGAVALFGVPCLLRPRSPAWLRLGLWAMAGGLCGWAGISHPGGLIFPAAQLLVLLRFPKAWAEHDGLTTGKRLAAWLVGAAVPVAIMAAVLAADWSNWVEYHRDLESRFVVVKDRLVAFWAPQWPWSIGSRPPLLAATLYSYCLNATTPWMQYPGQWLLIALFAAQSVFALIAAVWFLVRPCPSRGLLLRGVVWLAAGFVVMHFLYAFRCSPNYTFYPYLGLTVPLACAWVGWEIARASPSGGPRFLSALCACKRQAIMSALLGLVVSGILAVDLHFACYQVRAVRRLALAAPVTLDTQIAAAREMGARLGWADSTTPVYVDNYTWPAAGPRWKSLFEALLSERVAPAAPADRLAFQDDLLNQIYGYPGFCQVQLTANERRQRLADLLKQRRLAGVLLDTSPGSIGDCYYYAGAVDPVAPLQVGLLRGKGDVVWTVARHPVVPSVRRSDACRYRRLAVGTYMAALAGPCLAQTRLRVSLELPGELPPVVLHESRMCPLQGLLPQAVAVELSAPQTAILIEAIGAGASPSGDVQIELWGLAR
jgi:hypothetical protein